MSRSSRRKQSWILPFAALMLSLMSTFLIVKPHSAPAERKQIPSAISSTESEALLLHQLESQIESLNESGRDWLLQVSAQKLRACWKGESLFQQGLASPKAEVMSRVEKALHEIAAVAIEGRFIVEVQFARDKDHVVGEDYVSDWEMVSARASVLIHNFVQKENIDETILRIFIDPKLKQDFCLVLALQ